MFKSGVLLALSQLIVLACIPVLSRAYDLNQFSAFAVFFTFYTVGSALSNFRLSDAIVKESDEYKPFLVSLISIISVLMASFISILYFFYRDGIYLDAFFVFSSVFLYAVTRIFYFSDVSDCYYARASLWLAFINVLTVVMQIVFSDYENGLYLGLLAALLLTALMQVVFVRIKFKFCGWPVYKAILKKNEGYAKYLTFYSLVGGVRNRMVYFFVGHNPLGGVLNQFEKVSNAPNTLISSIIRPVVFSKIDVGEFKGAEYIVGGLFVILFSFVSPLLILVSGHSENLVLLIFGQQWVDYHNFFVVISSVYMVYMCVNWMDRIFDIISQQKTIFIVELAICLLGAVGFYLLSCFSLYEYMVYYHLGMVFSIMVCFFVFVYRQFDGGLKLAVYRLVQLGLIFSGHFLLYLLVAGMVGGLFGVCVFICLTALITFVLTLRMRVWGWIKESL